MKKVDCMCMCTCGKKYIRINIYAERNTEIDIQKKSMAVHL